MNRDCITYDETWLFSNVYYVLIFWNQEMLFWKLMLLRQNNYTNVKFTKFLFKDTQYHISEELESPPENSLYWKGTQNFLGTNYIKHKYIQLRLNIYICILIIISPDKKYLLYYTYINVMNALCSFKNSGWFKALLRKCY